MSYWDCFKSYVVDTAIETAFNLIDTNKNGVLGAGELVNLVSVINTFYDTKVNPTEEEMNYLIKRADINKDGSLSLDEVKKLLLG